VLTTTLLVLVVLAAVGVLGFCLTQVFEFGVEREEQ
tara:strand:+ start:148 stop:255 length:108 start_codon:yes stop_codon:yes gene_type:complete